MLYPSTGLLCKICNNENNSKFVTATLNNVKIIHGRLASGLYPESFALSL